MSSKTLWVRCFSPWEDFKSLITKLNSYSIIRLCISSCVLMNYIFLEICQILISFQNLLVQSLPVLFLIFNLYYFIAVSTYLFQSYALSLISYLLSKWIVSFLIFQSFNFWFLSSLLLSFLILIYFSLFILTFLFYFKLNAQLNFQLLFFF